MFAHASIDAHGRHAVTKCFSVLFAGTHHTSAFSPDFTNSPPESIGCDVLRVTTLMGVMFCWMRMGDPAVVT
jgi:hypothetical protein